jgi:hypothetical protein
VVPVQFTAAPHDTVVAACAHAPMPLQKPVLPQTLVVVAQFGGSAIPAPTFEQVPVPFRLHDWQAEQLELKQQTPSTQLPEEHSFVAAHVAPFAFLATQLPAVVALPVQ